MSEQDENKLIAERKSKLALLRKSGNPFVNDFKPSNLAKSLHEEFDSASNEILQAGNNKVSVAGRIMLKRIMGKASFVQLQDTSDQILKQLMTKMFQFFVLPLLIQVLVLV